MPKAPFWLRLGCVNLMEAVTGSLLSASRISFPPHHPTHLQIPGAEAKAASIFLMVDRVEIMNTYRIMRMIAR